MTNSQKDSNEAYEAAEEVTTSPPQKAKPKRSGAELLLRDILALLIKIAVIALVVVLLFTFMFGIYRNTDPSMSPSIADGDLVMYYRLDKHYVSGDVLVAKYEGSTVALRVVAVAGDTVDILEDGLYINGSLQLESKIYENTYRYADGVDFPLTVGEGEVFVLGDSRENATDSRMFGTVRIEDTYGKVMTIIRRRGI